MVVQECGEAVQGLAVVAGRTQLHGAGQGLYLVFHEHDRRQFMSFAHEPAYDVARRVVLARGVHFVHYIPEQKEVPVDIFLISREYSQSVLVVTEGA